MENFDQDGDDNNNNNGEYEVSEMCERLYETAGKCNRAMSNDGDSYLSSQQSQSETYVCNFIEEVIEGKYSDEGIISTTLHIGDYVKNFVKESHTEDVTDGQIAGIVLSLLACIFLGLYAASLRNYIRGDMAKKKKYYYGGQMKASGALV